MNSKADGGNSYRGKESDKIKITDLSVRAIIGTEPYEREDEQELILDLTLFTDIEKAGRTDNLEYTVDYSHLKDRILEMARESEFLLIESMAEEVARIALSSEKVEKVKVYVKKPAALNLADSAGVEITRYK